LKTREIDASRTAPTVIVICPSWVGIVWNRGYAVGMGILRKLANRLLGGDSEAVRNLVAERDSLIDLEHSTARTAGLVAELQERIRDQQRLVRQWEQNLGRARKMRSDDLIETAERRLGVANANLWEMQETLQEAMGEQARLDASYGHASEHRNRYLMRLTVLLNEGYPVHHLTLPEPPKVRVAVDDFAKVDADCVVATAENDDDEAFAARLFADLPQTPPRRVH